MSGIRLSRHFFPKMLEKNWGRIIFISNESSVFILDEMIDYVMIESFLDVSEIANAVTYDVCPLASGTNGAAIRVEGGLVR